MFQRARLYLNLTPAERALLRVVEFLLATALVAGIQAASPLLNAQTINWGDVAHTFLVGFVISLYAGFSKYFKAQGDPALPTDPAATEPAAGA